MYYVYIYIYIYRERESLVLGALLRGVGHELLVVLGGIPRILLIKLIK